MEPGGIRSKLALPLMTQEAPKSMRTVHVTLTVRGKSLNMRMDVPSSPVRPREMLPLFRSISQSLTDLAVKQVEAAGHRVSCRAGCGACCRQLVPISAVEAREIARMVEG